VSPERAFDAVRDAVVVVMEVAPDAVTRDTRLVTDLRCDSLALVEIAEILEERLTGLTIDDADLDGIETVGQAADYVAGRAP
jgi:acyl carrier protein